MKRYIKSSSYRAIFEDENFVFSKTSGIGMNNTPWQGLEVDTKPGSIAQKHVVEVRLNFRRKGDFDGNLVIYYYTDAYVAHGSRMTQDSLKDTEEYIEVLQDAVDFAYRVNQWLHENPEYSEI